ncbi:unnamed protein product [Microthlaspi erraticum]|uniref:GATA-type domain-containing protein n=1 Tax=Microthlaspi erraticum TaxID=1685480 RepID=A0A6D2HSY0_9BRAS|nr:unnamed protein product [Microthlaspi erraticum]
MESLELGLKDSNRNENAVNGGSAQNGDDFSVDDLLDFSNGDVFVEDETDLKVQRNRGAASVSLNDEYTIHPSNDFSTAAEEIGPLPTSELSVPMDDLAELEWLSNFVDDSFTPCSAAPTKKPAWLTGDRRHPVAPVNEELCFKPPPPARNRTKRARTGVSVWSCGSSSSSSSTSSSSSSGPSSPLWLSGAEFLDEPEVRRQKKKRKKQSSMSAIWKRGEEQLQTQTRRCGHCGVQETPQWRAGPMGGAKTLCNACGVSFKSGRFSMSAIWKRGEEQLQTQTRRCGHCGVQETPQWRAGPMGGAKTLCNACGVSFKSGRFSMSAIWKRGEEQLQTQTRRCGHCGVQETPQWRAGPMGGAKTLCNACGVSFKSGRFSMSAIWKRGQEQLQTQTRRCGHCGVQKTPQWRAGPMGAKTLCNACGVRFKSGRLLPEYRPACSPTFSSELHSNHHRKVVEMRRKKETSDDADDETSLKQPVQTVQAVPSF